MYGGVALFSGFVLYDTNKLVDRARALPVGYFDPASESVGIYLDAINLFVRIAQILGNNRSK
jgi:FtsH-binding integral membrane protein